LLKETERHPPGPEKKVRSPQATEPPKLKDLGITKKESSEAQLLASLPKEIQEEVIEGKKIRRLDSGENGKSR
jgi:hypothetical protein